MSNPCTLLKRSAFLVFLIFLVQAASFLPAYSQTEGDIEGRREAASDSPFVKERVSAYDLIRAENLIKREGAREAIEFYELLSRMPVEDERKGYVFFRMAKLFYAFGDHERAYENIEKAIPLLHARYNLYSAMFLRMKIFAEMGWYREGKQVAGFLIDAGYIGSSEIDLYQFMADAEVRLENPVKAAMEYEKAFVIGDYRERVEIYEKASDQLILLFGRTKNPFIFRNAFESASTLHFRILISYIAAKRCFEENMFGFAGYFLSRYFEISDFSGDEESGIAIERKLAEESYGKPVVAVYLPFTGPHSDFSFMVLAGLELALSNQPSMGGITGNSFFIEVHDTYGDTSMLARKIEEGELGREVIAVVGPLTGREAYFLESHGSSPLLFYLGQKYLDRGYGFINFGLKPSQEALKIVNYAFASGVFKAALLYPENGYGKAYRREVLHAAKMQGIEIIIDRSYPPETEDFKQLIKDIVREKNFDEYAGMEEKGVSMPVNFDGVFILDGPGRGLFLHSQMIYYNVKVPYFAFTSWVKEPFLNDEKGRLRNVYCVSDFNPFSSSEKVKEFVRTFDVFFGEKPDRFAGYGYDLATFFDSYLRSISVLGLDFPEIMERLKSELYGNEKYSGVTGKVEFYSHSSAIKNLTLIRIDRGNVTEIDVPVY